MTNQIFNDIIASEITGIECEIELIDKEIKKVHNQISRRRKEIITLSDRRQNKQRLLKRTKSQGTKLKKFVWSTDDPNIIELRNEILVTAKLIQESGKS